MVMNWKATNQLKRSIILSFFVSSDIMKRCALFDVQCHHTAAQAIRYFIYHVLSVVLSNFKTPWPNKTKIRLDTLNRKIFVKIIDGNMLTVLYLVVLPTVQTLVLDEQTSAQNSGDALLIMLAEEKQLRMQLANQVQALEKRVESVQSTMSDCGK